MPHEIVIVGVFVADTVYRAARLPRLGETLIGSGFQLGPGGKGSNQAVAAARAGADTAFLTRVGADAFGDMAAAIWQEAGVTPLAPRRAEDETGAAFVFVEDGSGQNAIIISPGAAAQMSAGDIDAHADALRTARVVVTQLEQPVVAAERALALARAGGAIPILNPAPATEIPDGMLALCDYVTPNETEAEGLTGIAVTDLTTAEAAGHALLDRGVRQAAILTLGEAGSLIVTADGAQHIPAMQAGAVVDTTGAGDAFNGGFAAALAEGQPVGSALRFATATAALAVTKHGTAQAMPDRAAIDSLLKGV